MIRTLLLGIVLLVGAVIVYEHGCRISESDVRAHHRAQLEALRRFDSQTMCDSMAKDFMLRSTEHVGGTQVRRDSRRDDTCEDMRDSTATLETISRRTRGLLEVDFVVDITRIDVAPGGRRASVEATTTASIAGQLISRSRTKGELSRAFWRIRDHGGEAQTWVYVQ